MPESSKHVLTRREALFLSASAGISMVAGEPALASDSIKTAAHQEPGNCSTPRSAVAKTQYGKVRGFVDGGVLTFKGVPYGQTTAGANRWLPAKPPTPWTDEYPALIYGANCPQNLHTWTSAEQTFLQDWDDGWQSCEQGTGNTPEAQALANKMAGAWAAFAATGNPSIPGLEWEPTNPETNNAMIWDNECRMAGDPEGDARKIIVS